MIIEKQGGYKFVVLGAGSLVEVQDDEIWITLNSGPFKLGEYKDREVAEEVLQAIESAYFHEHKIFRMP